MTENNGTGGVRITMKDIFAEVQRQGRLLEKVANSLPDTESHVADHEQRIRKLEMRMGWAVGVFGFLAVVMPILVTFMRVGQ
jgi:hypothetical protein